jgi:NADH-quinone oxidoreductase subunit C
MNFDMENIQLKEILLKIIPGIEIKETKQYLEIEVPPHQLHTIALSLKNSTELDFDYLYCLTGVDLSDSFGVVYHLESTLHKHQLVLKTKTAGRENPSLDTVSDIWPAAEFHEREVYDLLGVKFHGHPDLRRLFLDDDWGFPLRKDYRDDINIIER